MASDVASADTARTARTVVVAGSAGFGVAGLLAPNLLARGYGVTNPSPDYTFMARLWGSRNLAVAAMIQGAEPGAQRRGVLSVAAGMNAVDVVASLTASGLPVTTRLMAAATSGGFVAANLLALAHDA